MNRDEVRTIIVDWVDSRDHYYVGYALQPTDDLPPPYNVNDDLESLVSLVLSLIERR